MGTLGRALAVLLLAALPGPAAAGGGFEIRPIVQQGAAAPGAGAFTGFGEVQINDRGDVLFEGLIGDRRGLFLATGNRIVPVALQGEPTPLGGRHLQLSYFIVNDRQEVAFLATIERGPRERRQAPAAILLAHAGQARVIAKVRDPAPGQGTFKEFRDLALDASGRIAFFASLEDGDQPGGIFLHDGNVTRRLVAVFDPAPIGGRFKELSTPTLGPGGVLAFHGTVVHGGTRSGLFVVRGSGVEKVVATGEASPLGGTFTQLANPLFDDAGRLYFWGAVANGRFPATLSVADAQGLRPLASRGAESPAGPPYAYFGLNFSVKRGLAFQASLDGPAPNAAIFFSDSSGTRTVVRTGDPSPTGGVFSTLGDPAVNTRTEVVFAATADGRDGVYLAIPTSAR